MLTSNSCRLVYKYQSFDGRTAPKTDTFGIRSTDIPVLIRTRLLVGLKEGKGKHFICHLYIETFPLTLQTSSGQPACSAWGPHPHLHQHIGQERRLKISLEQMFSIVWGKTRALRGNPTQRRKKHKLWESNQGPPGREATVLTAAPL